MLVRGYLTGAVEVTAFINLPDRCGPQAQRGLNALELWACGCVLKADSLVRLEYKHQAAAKSW